jgi:hypothetical protein
VLIKKKKLTWYKCLAGKENRLIDFRTSKILSLKNFLFKSYSQKKKNRDVLEEDDSYRQRCVLNRCYGRRNSTMMNVLVGRKLSGF